MTIPQDIIETIRERTSLVDLISEQVQLKRTGRSEVGLCPFHTEKTPSFHVHDEEGYYHCFGCGKHGNAFGFVMETRGFSFPEAVRFLAARVGVNIPEQRRDSVTQRKQQSSRAGEARRVLGLAKQIYQHTLADHRLGAPGRAYLLERGIREDTVHAYGIGYAPEGWEYISQQIADAIRNHPEIDGGTLNSDKLLAELGLLKRRERKPENDSYYDAFRKRVVFPITRSDGAVIAFGGRSITTEDNSPKYINSPESIVYTKRKVLFGLSQAIEQIRKTRHVYFVEGYLDVFAMFQQGIINCIASCGTAVTEEHAQILRRLVDHITFVFDGDTAGRKAISQCFETFLNAGIETDAVLLPEGEDPDSLARSLDLHSFTEILQKSRKPVFHVFLQQMASENGLNDSAEEFYPKAAGKLASRLVTLLARIQNPVERELHVGEAAKHLGISQESLAIMTKDAVRNTRKHPGSTQRSNSSSQARHSSLPPSPQFLTNQRAKPTQMQATEEANRNSNDYVEHLLISILSQPQLAQRVLEMPALLNDTGVGLQENARRFIEALTKYSGAGVSKIVTDYSDELERESRLSGLYQLLNQHGFEAKRLITEAIRQNLVGGHQPAEVVENSEKLYARTLLSREVEQIRSEEAGESDPERQLRLAQAKLDKRRDLERLGEGEQ